MLQLLETLLVIIIFTRGFLVTFKNILYRYSTKYNAVPSNPPSDPGKSGLKPGGGARKNNGSNQSP